MNGWLELGSVKNPTQPVRWPTLPEINVRIRQITTSAQPTQIINGLPSRNVITINQPKPVTILGVRTAVLNSTTKTVSVSFLQNSADPNYQKTNIHLRIGRNQPYVAISGSTSPLTFTVPRTSAPTVLLAQAEGNWGAHPLGNSPSKIVNLS